MEKIRKFSTLKKINEADDNQQSVENTENQQMMQSTSNNTQQVINYHQQEETSKEGDKNTVVKFFSKLFESREVAHIYHLQVKSDPGSHAQHLALGEYYDNIIGLIDDLIEIYQGQFGIVENYDSINTTENTSKNSTEYFESIAQFIKNEKKCFPEDESQYFAIIDDILILIWKTLYKLKFLK